MITTPESAQQEMIRVKDMPPPARGFCKVMKVYRKNTFREIG
jgi:hypothetical protein